MRVLEAEGWIFESVLNLLPTIINDHNTSDRRRRADKILWRRSTYHSFIKSTCSVIYLSSYGCFTTLELDRFSALW